MCPHQAGCWDALVNKTPRPCFKDHMLQGDPPKGGKQAGPEVRASVSVAGWAGGRVPEVREVSREVAPQLSVKMGCSQQRGAGDAVRWGQEPGPGPGRGGHERRP